MILAVATICLIGFDRNEVNCNEIFYQVPYQNVAQCEENMPSAVANLAMYLMTREPDREAVAVECRQVQN